jgi:hypothetical protein
LNIIALALLARRLWRSSFQRTSIADSTLTFAFADLYYSRHIWRDEFNTAQGSFRDHCGFVYRPKWKLDCRLAQHPAHYLTQSGIPDSKPKLINLNATRIYWYRWTSATADTLLVSCDKSGHTAIYQLTATANLSPITSDDELPVMTIASPMNGYNFTFDRFKNSATGELHDMDQQGQLVKVSRQSGGNALPAYLAIEDAYLNLRIGRNGQSIQYGKEGVQRSELHLPARDLRQGGGLVSVTEDGKAYVLATASADTLGLIELDLRTGSRRTLTQEAVDVRRVVLNPRDLNPMPLNLSRANLNGK